MDQRLRELERLAAAGDVDAIAQLKAARSRTELCCARCGGPWGVPMWAGLAEAGMTCGACWPGPGWELAGEATTKKASPRHRRWPTGETPRLITHLAGRPAMAASSVALRLEWVVPTLCNRNRVLLPATVRWVKNRTWILEGLRRRAVPSERTELDEDLTPALPDFPRDGFCRSCTWIRGGDWEGRRRLEHARELAISLLPYELQLAAPGEHGRELAPLFRPTQDPPRLV